MPPVSPMKRVKPGRLTILGGGLLRRGVLGGGLLGRSLDGGVGRRRLRGGRLLGSGNLGGGRLVRGLLGGRSLIIGGRRLVALVGRGGGGDALDRGSVAHVPCRELLALDALDAQGEAAAAVVNLEDLHLQLVAGA